MMDQAEPGAVSGAAPDQHESKQDHNHSPAFGATKGPPPFSITEDAAAQPATREALCAAAMFADDAIHSRHHRHRSDRTGQRLFGVLHSVW